MLEIWVCVFVGHPCIKCLNFFPASTKIQSNQGILTSNKRNKSETDKSNNKTYTKEVEGVRINKEVKAEETKEHRRRYRKKGGTAPSKDCMQTEKNTMTTNNGTVDKPYARGRKEHHVYKRGKWFFDFVCF